jgi:invasion protein IalB
MSEIPPPSTGISFVDRIPPAGRQAALLAGLVIVGGLAGWIGRGVVAGPPDVPVMQVFQDWRVICPARKEKDAHCSLSSEIPDPTSGQTVAGLRIITEVDATKKTTSQVMMVNVPLGVSLEPGIGLRIGGDVKAYPYKTCLEGGCVAVVPVTDELQDSIVDANDAALVVAGGGGQTVPLPFSTKGLADARRALRTFEAKRSSWWWRLWL